MDESENMGQGGTTRRAVLAGLAGATAIAALPVTVSAGIAPVAVPVPAEMPASFLTASSKLCGLPLDKSYIELAGTIWKTQIEQYKMYAVPKQVHQAFSTCGFPCSVKPISDESLLEDRCDRRVIFDDQDVVVRLEERSLRHGAGNTGMKPSLLY